MDDKTPLTRWADAPPSDERQARAAEVAKVVADLPPRPVHAGDWEDVLLRAARPRRSGPLVLAFVATTAVALVLGVVWQRRHALPGPSFVPSREAKVLVAADSATLSFGRLEVSTHAPARLETPHVSVQITGRAAAEVDAFSTTVEVYEGVATVRAADSVTELRPGESRRWPSAPPLPPALQEAAPPPATSEACDERPPGERLACLEEESKGQGLAAQVALYQRGAWEVSQRRPQAAEPLWRESLRRFPDGVLAPEVRLHLLRWSLERRRFKEAIEEAREFERRCADDPRAADVTRLRLALEARVGG